MRNVFDKDILRTMRQTLGRFLAIAAIVALGCGFYAGLRMTAPDMRAAADAYFDASNLMDIRVVSTMGLTGQDIRALSEVEGVEAAYGAYEADVMAALDGDQYAMRIHSLPEEADGAVAGKAGEGPAVAPINQLELAEGRWPESPDECVVSADRVMNETIKVGDVVDVGSGATDLDDVLAQRSFTIVGLVHSPYYVSNTALGTTSLGSGAVQQYLYVPDASFDPDYPYTEAFVLVAGASDAVAGSPAYQQKVDAVAERITVLAPEREQARKDQLESEVRETLDEKRAEFDDRKAQAEAQLADAKRTLDDARRQIANNEAKLEQGERQLAQARSELDRRSAEADQRFAQAQRQIDQNRAKAQESQSQLPGLRDQRAQAQQQEQQLQGQLAQVESGLAACAAALANPALPAEQRAALERQQEQLNSQKTQVEQGLAQVQAGIKQLDDGIRQIEQAPAAVESAQNELFAQKQKAQTELAQARGQVDEKARELAQGREQLSQARAEWQAGQDEYERNRQTVQRELDDGQAKLDEAQATIDDIALPEWLVMDRTKNPGVVTYGDDADRMDSIAAVFPLFFFLVAALVALTTMTRMVDEERMLIGTFKSLGYSKARIIARYLVYSGVASLAGAIVGILAMSQILPAVIVNAYAIVYHVPPASYAVDLPIAALACIAGVGVTLAATWGAAYATLAEPPAALLQPRVPKAGKRILLERMGPLWRRCSFSWKVTLRNLFRYKKRLFMTVVGIAGCTALLLTGLGLHNAVNDIIDNQYGSLIRHNATVTLSDDAVDADREAVEQVMGGSVVSFSTPAQTSAWIAQRPANADPQGGPEGQEWPQIGVTVVVPEDPAAFQQIWTMRTREGHEPVALDGTGVVLTEKLAARLGLDVGSRIEFAEQDAVGNATDVTHDATVSGIIENYINDYAFFTAQGYERAFGEPPRFSTFYVTLAEGGQDVHGAQRQEFVDQLDAIPGVGTVAFNDETIDTYRTMLGSVNMVVVVLVAAAAALAFVVLYNLTNINISERVREIATLKVLGFRRGEVYRYVFRETIILSVLGALAGLAFGVVLEGFVASSAEVDQVMFGRAIHPESFAIAFALTIVFTLVVMLLMRRKLDAVDMVDSLKSNE